MKKLSAPLFFLKTKQRRILTVFVLVLIILMLFHRQEKLNDSKASSRVVLSSDDLALAKKESFIIQIPISGELYPFDQTTVIAKVSAEAEAVYVREGQQVKKNQVLAQLNTADLEQTLNEKEAVSTSAEASYQFSVNVAERYKKLLANKYYSQNDYDIAVNQLQVNRANVKQAQAALAEAKLQLKYASIVSIMDGIVSERDIDPGMNVSVGQTLFKVVNLEHMELRALIPADQISRIQLNQMVTFSVDGMSAKFSGKIVRINPSTVSGTRAYYAYIDVDNFNKALKNGMFVTGGVILKKEDNSIVIPLQAVHYEKKNVAYVYKINQKNEVQKQAISVGITDSATNKAQVLAGLNVNDLVIISEIDIEEGSEVMLPVSQNG
jgi:membrane fusion protein, multidrug efflux system